MTKFTYNKLGQDSSYAYESSEMGKPKVMVVSDTLDTINVVNGDDNFIREMITNVDNIGSEITDLEDDCFKECPNLTSINLPVTLSSIGNNSFKDCFNLSVFKNNECNIPQATGNNIFENCKFKELNIKNQTPIGYSPEVGDYMFFKNNNLEKVTEDYLFLGGYMFKDCEKLSSITFSKNETDGKEIYCGNNVFDGCSKLSSITLPTYISSYYDLNPNFLTNSNITLINAPGISKKEAIYAIGGEERLLYKTTS
jgi:hypothetical protein